MENLLAASITQHLRYPCFLPLVWRAAEIVVGAALMPKSARLRGLGGIFMGVIEANAGLEEEGREAVDKVAMGGAFIVGAGCLVDEGVLLTAAGLQSSVGGVFGVALRPMLILSSQY